ELYQAQGKFDTALVYFVKRSQLCEELYRDNPKSESLKNGLAISYEKLGELYQAQGKFDTALVYFVKRSQLGEELYRDNPESADLLFGLGVSYYKLANLYEAMGQIREALGYLEKALPVFNRLYDITGLDKYREISRFLEKEIRRLQSPSDPLVEQISALEQKIENSRDYAEKARLQELLLALVQRLLDKDPDNPNLRAYAANAQGAMARYRLFTREFPAAEAAARKALELAPEQAEWVHTNLALALLFQGKYKDAEAIYKRYKGKPYDEERGWTQVFLADLDELEKAGITHPDVKRIRKLLEK
ncbi:MAG: tetratricopeptide repeat protein, partial [Saprospiraceae bacterium]|nr:tetratricopeptide repeat protein [Saprospiraceae bacterium]